jgi:hypothetical protein
MDGHASLAMTQSMTHGMKHAIARSMTQSMMHGMTHAMAQSMTLARSLSGFPVFPLSLSTWTIASSK